MTLYGMWLRVFDSSGIVVSATVIALVLRWMLKDKLVGHRKTVTILLICTILRGIAAILATKDYYFHGALTQSFSSALTFCAWGLAAGEIYRSRHDLRKTFRASETATILEVEKQLDGETLDNTHIWQDNLTLKQSRELASLSLEKSR